MGIISKKGKYDFHSEKSSSVCYTLYNITYNRLDETTTFFLKDKKEKTFQKQLNLAWKINNDAGHILAQMTSIE